MVIHSLELFVKLRACLLEVGLTQIEDIIHGQLRIHVVLLLLFGIQLSVGLIRNLLFRFLIDNSEYRQSYRRALLTLVDHHTRQVITILVVSRNDFITVLLVVEGSEPVEGAPNR